MGVPALGARSLLRDSRVASSGLSPGKDAAGAAALPARPRPASRALHRLVARSVTQPELRASEWQNFACQIKLGTSKLKIHIYFNQSGCSERDEREGR